MNPDISEFSYGYALTETLINAAPAAIRAAPVFPSLIEEGKTGGGYDVKIPFSGFPLFLQFKLSHYMVRDSAFEVQRRILCTPFYRMHLRPTKHSQQHPMLLALEASGAAVYYAAPHFHTPADLNDAYLSKQVVDRSIFLKPSEIGLLPDDNTHHVSFRNGYPTYLCSHDPRCLRGEGDDRSGFVDDLLDGYRRYEHVQLTDEGVRVWNDRLMKIIKEHLRHLKWISDQNLNSLQDQSPLNLFAYLASTFFGCSVIVVAPQTNNEL